MLREVYRRFDIAPASIGLVETHGTGTPLGDPIEIEGLRAGFGEQAGTVRVAIGSVKSNVGHLLAAAGVAGALKAMLALEHGELPPSINFERQNGHLALAGSPFHVQNRLAPWPASPGIPRRAAVSAFGFSGTNAHLVLEEYGLSRPAVPAAGPFLCILSARSTAQLAAQAQLLAARMEASPGLDPGEICRTLQTGRRAFECRAAFVFSDRRELLVRLQTLASGRTAEEIHLSGGDGAARTLFADDGDARELLDKWLATGRLEQLARLWVQGAEIDWQRLSTAAGCRRVHLPAYPFARDRHWVKSASGTAVAAGHSGPISGDALIAGGKAGDRHFSSRIRGDEGYLSHFAVAGERLLSGLFYPEMARAAGELASGKAVLGVRHLVWGPPLRINGASRQLAVQVQTAEGGWLYRIGAEEEQGIACQVGELWLAGEGEAVRPVLPLPEAEEECTAAFRARRPAARGIVTVQRGGSGVRARWSRPPGEASLGFDPLMLDAVWQLAVFLDQEAGLDGPRFPLALESLYRDGPAADEGWICVSRDEGNRHCLNAVVFDLAGKPGLWMDGLMSERLDALGELRFEL